MKVALVHDYLTQFGGAEQVLTVLAGMYPDAPIVTSLYNPAVQLPGVHPARIHESMLGKFSPLRSRHRYATPAYPMAMRNLARWTADADVIIADSSAWSHQIPRKTGQRLIVYCHSPARFLYGDPDYLNATNISGRKARLVHRAFSPLRSADRTAWLNANIVLANSRVVAKRLQDAVGVEANVVYPPIDVDFFRPVEPVQRDLYLLVVSRLVAHKAIDLVIRTANRYQLPVRIIGSGRDQARLQAMAGPTVEFLGFQSRESIRDHMQCCLAFVLPGVEDFGMTAVEAQAAGSPVLAIGRGGATESVVHQKTGYLFDEQTIESLHRAYLWIREQAIDPEECLENASRFSISRFEDGIQAAVEQVTSIKPLR